MVNSAVMLGNFREFKCWKMSCTRPVNGVKGLKGCVDLFVKPIAELCHIASHSVTCHQTQVNAPHLNPSQAGW